MKKIIIIASIFFINVSCIYYLIQNEIKNKEYQESANNVLGIERFQIKISALIGRGKFSVFGYGPSSSLITLSGIGLYEETYSEDNGFFEFKNKYLPMVLSEPCLSAQDKLGRLTTPVCIPPIPQDEEANIGPILLPPSISVDKPDYFKGDEVIFTGQTMPDSEVSLSMFTDKTRSSLSMSVYAFIIPELTVKTDKNGNYSVTLPSAKSESFRVFAQSSMNSDMTPKSNTIKIKILPFWMLFVKFLVYIWSTFKQRIIEIIIISQIIALLAYLFKYYFHPHKIAVQRAIILRKKSPLITIES
jgi:hypothetical protein